LSNITNNLRNVASSLGQLETQATNQRLFHAWGGLLDNFNIANGIDSMIGTGTEEDTENLAMSDSGGE
jgi:hypothetical protein